MSVLPHPTFHYGGGAAQSSVEDAGKRQCTRWGLLKDRINAKETKNKSWI